MLETVTTQPSAVDAGAAPSAASPGRSSWTPVIALASGIAALVASEFLPASVLPMLAADIGVSEGVAGLAVAATAIAGAATAPSIAVVLPRMDRRLVLIALLVIGTLANLSVAVAPSFGVLLVGRLLLGIAIAGFWSFAFVAGTHAVPGRDHIVSSGIAFGVSFATVIGIPVASIVGDGIGWRATFVGAAALTTISALAIAAALPSVPAHPGAGFRMLRYAVRNRRLMAAVAFVALAAFGNFAAYPYIRIATERIDADSTSWLLLAWGLGGLVGTVLAGTLARRLRLLAAGAPLLVAASLLLTATATSLPPLAVAIVIWGFAFSVVPVATQLWVSSIDRERTESAMALQVTAFQVAIMLGAATGGALLDEFGIGAPLVAGAIAAAAAGLGFATLRSPRS